MANEKSHFRAYQASDQMICSACGKAWDMNDPDPPACISAEEFAQREDRRRRNDLHPWRSSYPKK